MIRQAKKNDQMEIKQFVISVMKKEGTYDERYHDADLEEIENAYFRQNGEFLVADERGKIIGTVGVFGINKDFAQLMRYYVHPEFRGKGVGRTLLDRILSFCKDKGYRGIVTISESELERAFDVYYAAGFRVFKKTDKVNYFVKSVGRKDITEKELRLFTETKWKIEWKDGKWQL